jgi:CDP-paratose 2-epimerase
VRVVITGGAGFIGSSIALALAERHTSWEIVAVDNLFRRGSEHNVSRLKESGVEFVHADVRQLGDLERVGGLDALVECSAEPSVLAASELIFPVNVAGAYNCFEIARRHGAQVVFLSTSRVYPIAALSALSYAEAETRFELSHDQSTPGASAAGIAESFPLEGARTFYGASKYAAEVLLGEYDLAWVVNRCGVVAGPWQMGKVDQGVFTHWMLSFYFGRPLTYIGFGGHGKQVRDLLHVADLVDLTEQQLLDPAHWAGRTYNVGGGAERSLSLVETTAICRELTGREVPISQEPDTRSGDVPLYVSDCRALFNHTDWRPRFDARAALADIFSWIHDHEHLIRTTLT